jgi:hypothetical protein
MEGTLNNTHTDPQVQDPNPAPQGSPEPADPSTPPAPPAPSFDFKAADDETKLKAYNEMFGKNYKSLDEIFPPAPASKEELEAAAEEKRKTALAWAISSGKLSQEAIEKAVIAKSKTPRDIAKEVYASELREADPDISDEDIESGFQDFYHEDKDEKSAVRRAALKRMEKVANEYLVASTKDYDSVESEYEAEAASKQQYGNYTTSIKAIAKEIPKAIKVEVPYQSADGSTIDYSYDIPVDEKVIEAVRKDFLHENTFKFLGADAKAEDIKAEMISAIHGKLLPIVVAEVVRQDRANVEKEVLARLKNIPTTGQGSFTRTPPVGVPKTPIKHSYLEAASNNKR